MRAVGTLHVIIACPWILHVSAFTHPQSLRCWQSQQLAPIFSIDHSAPPPSLQDLRRQHLAQIKPNFRPLLLSNQVLESAVPTPLDECNDSSLVGAVDFATTGAETSAGSPSMSELSLPIEGTSEDDADAEYKRGLATIAFITLIFSSMSPALHAALADVSHAPPVLLLNSVVSGLALCGLVFGGPLLEASTPLPRSLVQNKERQEIESTHGFPTENRLSLPQEAQAGLELGTWKFLGTTANLYGLSLTTANHGAFLIQMTTLIVPTVQGIMGVPIPNRIKAAIALALAGVFIFTQDPGAGGSSVTNGETSNLLLGDALCVVAAGFYATYDLRLFKWGKLVKPRELITGKILTQALLSLVLLLAVGYDDASDYLSSATWDNARTVALLALWSGLAVNAVAPFLQVGGQQAVGPTRAQTLYASQPLWAAILSYFFLGETVGTQGVIGGAAFLTALGLAATAEPPDPNCDVENCEV